MDIFGLVMDIFWFGDGHFGAHSSSVMDILMLKRVLVLFFI